jgi:hypothetical protein
MSGGRTAVLLVLILLAVFAGYERVLDGPAIFDDGHLFDRPDTPTEPNRRLTHLTFSLNFALFGEETFSFHLTNLILHGLAVLAGFALLRELLLLSGTRRASAIRIAALGAALFALSPVQTAAVSYIWQRATVLAGGLVLASLWLFAAGLRRHGLPAGWRIAIAIALLPPAILAKQNAVMLVPAMLGLVFLFRPPRRRPFAAATAAALILAVTAVAVSLFWWGSLTPIDRFSETFAGRPFTLGERLLTQPRVVVSLLATVLLPLPGRLNLDHDVALSTGLFTPWTTLPALLCVIALVTTGLLCARRHPIVGLGLLWFPVFLVPESSVVPLELAFDHRAYLPSVGIFLLAALGLRSLAARHPRPGGVAIALILCAFATLTFVRNDVWTSRVRMWEDAAGKSPAKARPHFNLALAYRDAGEPDRVLAEFRRALVLAPDHVDYAAGLNALALRRGQPDELRSIAVFHREGGRYLSAEELLAAAIALRPADPDLRVDLALTLAQSGGRDAAIAALEEALRLGFDDAVRLRRDFSTLRRDPRFRAFLDRIE